VSKEKEKIMILNFYINNSLTGFNSKDGKQEFAKFAGTAVLPAGSEYNKTKKDVTKKFDLAINKLALADAVKEKLHNAYSKNEMIELSVSNEEAIAEEPKLNGEFLNNPLLFIEVKKTAEEFFG
jgi:serine protease inhibitor